MQRLQRRTVQHLSRSYQRRGILMPAILVALVVLVCCLAWALDSLWIDNTESELAAGADAAVLAACRQLATDDLLRADVDWKTRLQAARRAARDTALRNRAGGMAIEVNAAAADALSNAPVDLRFGQPVVTDSGQVRFLETDLAPNAVALSIERSRRRGNPIALFFRGLTGQETGEARVQVQAMVDNRIRGLQPTRDGFIPALPIAILGDDVSGGRVDTWQMQIEQRVGADLYSWNAKSGRVELGGDGIPEITLLSQSRRQDAGTTNVNLIDVGTDLRTQALIEQIEHGFSERDLSRWDGRLLLDGPLEMPSAARIDRDVTAALQEHIGLPRVMALARQIVPAGPNGYGQVLVNGFVAGRLMEVTRLDDDVVKLTVQPTVMTTPTARIIPEAQWLSYTTAEQQRLRNRYLYKLQLKN